MLDFLGDILNGILDLPYLIVAVLVEVLNALIVALAAIVEAALSLLPPFPDPPSAPGGVIGALLWFVPLGAMLSFFALMLTAWVTFLGVKVALKWGKVL